MFKIAESVDEIIDVWKRLNPPIRKVQPEPEPHPKQLTHPKQLPHQDPTMQILSRLRSSKQDANRIEVELERAVVDAEESSLLVQEISNLVNMMTLRYEVRRRKMLNSYSDDIM